jgi:hypothetical protein
LGHLGRAIAVRPSRSVHLGPSIWGIAGEPARDPDTFLYLVTAFSLQIVVGEQLLAQIHVRHDHTTTAISAQAEGIHGISFAILCLQ